MSPWWSAVLSSEVTISFDGCYSRWYVDNNITPVIEQLPPYPPFLPGREVEYATNGFFCAKMDYFCFTSARAVNPWWRADLGAPRIVSLITISTRKGAQSQFQDVVVTLGNSSNYLNPTFDNMNGVGAVGANIDFTPVSPVTGRYLQVQSVGTDIILTICDIQILG